MNLKEYREQLDITGGELARMIGVNKAVISRYENDVYDIKNIRLKNAVKLRDALKMENTKDILKLSNTYKEED